MKAGDIGLRIEVDPRMDRNHIGLALDYGLGDRSVLSVWRIDGAGKPIFVGQFGQGNPIEFRDGRPVIDVEEVK